jgi:long-chain acyl-CoA synthetase
MEVKRLFDIFPYQQEKFPQSAALGGKANGVWETYSTAQVIEITDSIALGLLALGLKKGDAIGLISENAVEWAFADHGIQKMGGIVIPLYPTSSKEDLAYILNHCEAKLCFCQSEDLYDKIKSCQPEVPSLQHLYTFREVKGAKNYKELKENVTAEGRNQLTAIQETIKPMDLATIIYTSGTTGKPKGVMLSHNNIVANIFSSIERLPVGKGDVALSFLPLSHIFERMINYMYFSVGISTYYAESMDKIGDNLKEIRPMVFTAVPRLLEKVFDRVMAGGNANKGFKKKIFLWAAKLAEKWEPDGKGGFAYGLKMKIADKMVFSKIRKKAGLDRVRAVASGSAALQIRLFHFYNGIGVPLTEGYGLTETSPVISVGGFGPGEMKIGYVGTVINGGTIKIAADGEILYKGPNVMMGYYKEPAMTAEVMDSEGWFHTGDIGEVDAQGFVRITDRKKEMWKTSGGKYIAPQVLENKLKESPFIEQVVIVGEGKNFPGALIVPNFEHLYSWMKEEGMHFNKDMPAAVVSMDKVKAKIASEVAVLNQGFGKWEMIKQFELLPTELSVATGELTPKLSIKRKVVYAKYATEIDKIYAGKSGGGE